MTKTQLFRCVILIALTLSAKNGIAQKDKACDLDFLPGLWARVSNTRDMPADSTIERLRKIKADTTYNTWDIQRDLSIYVSGMLYGRTLKTQILVAPNTCKFSFGKEPSNDPVNMKEILEINRKFLFVRSYNSKGVPEYLFFVRLDWR